MSTLVVDKYGLNQGYDCQPRGLIRAEHFNGPNGMRGLFTTGELQNVENFKSAPY